MSFDISQIDAKASKYPKGSLGPFSYGTAGFRMKAANLKPVMFRVGCLAALRSLKLNGKVMMMFFLFVVHLNLHFHHQLHLPIHFHANLHHYHLSSFQFSSYPS
jgi:hypothetical protein